MLGFGPYSLDLGPKGNKALRLGQGGWTYLPIDRQTDSPCVLQDFVPFGVAAQKPSKTLIFALLDWCHGRTDRPTNPHVALRVCNPKSRKKMESKLRLDAVDAWPTSQPRIAHG